MYLYIYNRLVNKIQNGWKAKAQKHNLKIHSYGLFPLSHFGFDYEKPLVYKTLFTLFMLDHGFLANTAFYASYADQAQHVESYLKAVDEVFAIIAEGIQTSNPEELLRGSLCHSEFKRLT